MGVIARQSLKSSTVSYFGLVIGYVITLFIYPKFLETREIGLVKVLLSAGMLFTSLAHLGMTNVVSKYISAYKEKEIPGFLFFCFGMPIIGFVIFSILLILFKDGIVNYFAEKSPLIGDYIYYTIPLTLILMYYGILSSYSRSIQRLTVPTFLRDVILRIFIIGLIVAYSYYALSLDNLIQGFVLIHLIPLAILIFYLLKISPHKLKIDFSFTKLENFKEIRSFSFFSMLFGASGILIVNIDNIMISGQKGLKYMGIYSIAFAIGMVVEIPRRSISQMSYPILSKHWHKNEPDKILELYQKSSLTQTVLASIIFILTIVNAEYFLDIMPNGEAFKPAIYVIYFISAGKWIEACLGLTGEIITTSKLFYYNLSFILSLVGITILTNWIFIPMYGITGAALASGISIAAFCIIKAIFIYFRFKIQPFTINTLKMLLIAGLTFGISLILPELDNPYFNMIYKSILLASIYGGLTFFMKISKDINEMVCKYIPILRKWN